MDEGVHTPASCLAVNCFYNPWIKEINERRNREIRGLWLSLGYPGKGVGGNGTMPRKGRGQWSWGQDPGIRKKKKHNCFLLVIYLYIGDALFKV